MAPPFSDKPGAHLPFPPMPAAWRDPDEVIAGPAPPKQRPVSVPPVPAVAWSAPPAAALPVAPCTAAWPVPRQAAPWPDPRPAWPVLNPASPRPLSPMPYPGLPASGPPQPGWDGMSSRSGSVAGVLQLLLGGFGVGRFYTGHVGLAVAQIAVAWGVLLVGLVLGFVFMAPFLVCWVGFAWPVLDGVGLIRGGQRDSDGLLLRP